ncbi:MAG: phospholipase D-like domain-containing protein [Aggregatilineales bacterium]
MAKKKSTSKSNDSRSIITGIIGAIIIALAAWFGVDLSGVIDTGTGDVPGENTGGNVVTGNVTGINLQRGFGAEARFWQVYFTEPTGSNDTSLYNGGVDEPLASAIDNVRSTLDIAAFEWANPRLNAAVLRAHQRGVTVRMVVDDEHTDMDSDGMINELIDAGIPVVGDERSGLMHNKFMIMDSTIVWTGSMNFTEGGSYRNNNNLLRIQAPQAVTSYQAEFNEMLSGDFGSSRSESSAANFFTDEGTQVQIIFAPEDDVDVNMVNILSLAEESIRFMTFSFTLDEVGDALLERSAAGVDISGIFEVRGSETSFSEMTRLFCAGMDMRQDGNPFTFHHKVFIIDESIVMTGSFNISANATTSNDENQIIISDPDLAAQYIAEFDRRMAESRVPDGLSCP